MGTMTFNLSEEAESWVRGKNRMKGDMSRYIETLIIEARNKAIFIESAKVKVK
jgi:hypothetical protein